MWLSLLILGLHMIIDGLSPESLLLLAQLMVINTNLMNHIILNVKI